MYTHTLYIHKSGVKYTCDLNINNCPRRTISKTVDVFYYCCK